MSDLFFILFFVPISSIVFALTHGRLRTIFTIIFSLCFAYICGVGVLISACALTVLTYAAMKVTQRLGNVPTAKNIVFAVVLLFETMLLFLLHFVNSPNYTGKIVDVVFPVGISFMCMQSVMLVDEARSGEITQPVKFWNTAVCMIWYPKLLMGPVVSYDRFTNIFKHRKITYKKIGEGAVLYSAGLAEKVIIADSLWKFIKNFTGTSYSEISTALAWYAIFDFMLYVMFLFSSYSLMSKGLSLMAGINLSANSSSFLLCDDVKSLNSLWNKSVHGYLNKSIDKIFVKNRFTQCLVPFLVSFAYGIWFGFSLQSVIFGLITGIFAALDTFWQTSGRVTANVRKVLTLVILCFAFMLLIPVNSADTLSIFKVLVFRGTSVWNTLASYYIVQYFPVTIIAVIIAVNAHVGLVCNYNLRKKRNSKLNTVIEILFVIFALLISCLLLVWNNGTSEIQLNI